MKFQGPYTTMLDYVEQFGIETALNALLDAVNAERGLTSFPVRRDALKSIAVKLGDAHAVSKYLDKEATDSLKGFES